MKTIIKSLFILLVAATLATLASCVKDPLYPIDPDDNVLVHNSASYEMDCRFSPPFHDQYNIDAVSVLTFIGSPLMSFHFHNIPYEMLGQTIDLTEKSEYTLAFNISYHVNWFSSPEGVCGTIGEDYENSTSYPDESPFRSGTMTLTEDETGITFVLRGVLKNGDTFRMKLFAPVEE
jgi:predicted small lipoprotein YifL